MESTPLSPYKRYSRLAVASFALLMLTFFSFFIDITFGRYGDIALFNSNIFAYFCPFLYGGSLLLGILAIIAKIKNKDLKGWAFAFPPFILLIIYLSFLPFMYSVATRRAAFDKENRANYNLATLGKTIASYSRDHNGCLPDANQWRDSLLEYDKNLTTDNFRHPKINGRVIGFNSNLSKLRLDSLPADVVLLFEVQGDSGASGGEDVFVKGLDDFSFVTLLLVNMEIKNYSFQRNGYTVWDDNTLKFFDKPLRWKP